MKNQEDCKVWWLRTSALRRYKGNCGIQNGSEKFRAYFEKQASNSPLLQKMTINKSTDPSIFLNHRCPLPRGINQQCFVFIHFHVISLWHVPNLIAIIFMSEKTMRYFFSCRFLEQEIHMEHFWVTGLIALVFSSLVSSEEKYIMEKPDCTTCIWSWDTAAYVHFPGFKGTVCFRYHLNGLH